MLYKTSLTENIRETHLQILIAVNTYMHTEKVIKQRVIDMCVAMLAFW